MSLIGVFDVPDPLPALGLEAELEQPAASTAATASAA
jgi:hypothetical protein